MKLNDLIETLENLRDCHDAGDSPVYLAHQPRWPFEFTIGGVIAHELTDEEEDVEDVGKTVIYIAEGSSQEYLSEGVSDALECEGIW